MFNVPKANFLKLINSIIGCYRKKCRLEILVYHKTLSDILIRQCSLSNANIKNMHRSSWTIRYMLIICALKYYLNYVVTWEVLRYSLPRDDDIQWPKPRHTDSHQVPL